MLPQQYYNEKVHILTRDFSYELYVLHDDDKRYAIETCRSSESVLKKWFKINYIQLMHLLVVWWLVNIVEVLEICVSTITFNFCFETHCVQMWILKHVYETVKHFSLTLNQGVYKYLYVMKTS